MIALMCMTNPMWEWIIAPLLLIGIGVAFGYWLRIADETEKKSLGRPKPYDWEQEDQI
jgi:hypothetical protein